MSAEPLHTLTGQRHRLLARQLRKHLGKAADHPSMQAFLDAVEHAYEQADKERALLERSIDLTSRELIARNQELREQINALEDTQAELEESYSLLQATLHSTHEALLLLDLDGNIRLTNPNFDQMFQLDNIENPPCNIHGFLAYADSLFEDIAPFRRAVRTWELHPKEAIESEFRTHQGRHIELYCRPHMLKEQHVGQVWSFRDVTELKLKEEEARHRAYHDLLTGLPNRRLLGVRLNHALKTAESRHQRTAVLFIDLDGFKDVNDSLGHGVGDALLKEVTKRLEYKLPPHTLLARQGGDEFVAVMENQQDRENINLFCNKILDAFTQPFHLGEEEIYMSASIGIAIAPEHGDDANKLISNADIAMYHAKQLGKNTFEFFNVEKDAQTSHRLRIRNQLNIALEQQQFELFFQPKICLETGSIKGAEALIRWQSESGEFRSPIEFIPVAEASGQIIPISQWVIQRCCEHLKSWQSILDDDFILALNISAKHFQKGLLQDDMAQAIEHSGVDPSKLELEVTETAIMDDVDLAVDTLKALKRQGIRTAIDDFGTGHSSLSYLRKLPIEILKIDKSFIDEILTSQEDRTLVKGIIDMVHALGIEVVAEGVENHQMAELLSEMKCDLVQGYHYCPPISEAEFVELLKSRQCYI